MPARPTDPGTGFRGREPAGLVATASARWLAVAIDAYRCAIRSAAGHLAAKAALSSARRTAWTVPSRLAHETLPIFRGARDLAADHLKGPQSIRSLRSIGR